jgi:ACT domain-containing protein
METKKNRVIITVVGKDTVGIIAKICTYLARNNMNILDISQTIIDGFFNMMMIVDISNSEKPFSECSDELAQLGEEIGVKVGCQKEEIFNKMHRI